MKLFSEFVPSIFSIEKKVLTKAVAKATAASEIDSFGSECEFIEGTSFTGSTWVRARNKSTNVYSSKYYYKEN